MMATRWAECLLLANIHSNGRSCSLAALKETAAAVLVIFAGGDNGDDDVIHFAFLFVSMSNTEKKCLAKADDDVIAAANAIPLAQ